MVMRECNGNLVASTEWGPVTCHVTNHGVIEADANKVVLRKGPETRYELYDSNRFFTGVYTCMSIASTDKESLFLSATIVPPDGSPYDRTITFNLLDEEKEEYPLLTVTAGRVMCCDPDSDELTTFATLLDTYAFTGMTRCWSMKQEGCIRFTTGGIRFGPGSDLPQFHWTETNAVGVPVQKTRYLERNLWFPFEPMFPIMRKQGLAIEMSICGTKCISTLVDQDVVSLA
jgi:hypothetical protein